MVAHGKPPANVTWHARRRWHRAVVPHRRLCDRVAPRCHIAIGVAARVMATEASLGEIGVAFLVLVWVLVRPHLAGETTARLRNRPAVIGAISLHEALSISSEAVCAIVLTLLDVASLVAFAVVEPGRVAARHAAIERKVACMAPRSEGREYVCVLERVNARAKRALACKDQGHWCLPSPNVSYE